MTLGEWVESGGDADEVRHASDVPGDRERCSGEGCDALVAYANGYPLHPDAPNAPGVLCLACHREAGGCRHAVTAGAECDGCLRDRRLR